MTECSAVILQENKSDTVFIILDAGNLNFNNVSIVINNKNQMVTPVNQYSIFQTETENTSFKISKSISNDEPF